MKPSCWNREAFTDPNAGWKRVGTRIRVAMTDAYGRGLGIKNVPVYRYRHPWFTDRCTVHDKADIGPGQTYAQFHNWQCEGCRHFPREST